MCQAAAEEGNNLNMPDTFLSSGLSRFWSFVGRAGLSISLYALAAIATAQNLVPNWSFEDTAYCTTATNPILVAPPWFSANNATPDVYNMDDGPCGVFMDPGETIGLICYQAPFDGVRFAGEYLWENGGELKEYMEVELNEPLQAGHAYRVAMEISLPDCWQWAVNALGAFFSPDTVFDPTLPNPGVLPVTPQAQFHEPSFYTDEVNWMHVEDTIVAAGGERYMVIGSFTSADSTETLAVPGSFGFSHAYYYFDAVVVEEITGVEGIGEGLTITGQDGLLGLHWPGMERIDHVSVHDLRGRYVLRSAESVGGASVSIDLRSLAQGSYVIEAASGTQRAVAKWMKMK